MATTKQLLEVYKSLEARILAVSKQIGPQGDKGDKGDKGDVGPMGLEGRVGPKGPEGSMGPKGADGLDGARGRDGTDGVSITDVDIDFDNHLKVQLSDGTEIDAGFLGNDTKEAYHTFSHSRSGGGGDDAKDVFVSDNAPTASTDQYLWIQTGLGDSGDCFTVWFNDPNF
jgi:hypothetical protein